MAKEVKRISFAVTEEMQYLLDRAKKNLFYNYNQSDMIRILLQMGLSVIEEQEARKKEDSVNS